MEIDKAFEMLCQEITRDVTLAYPSDNLPYLLGTDASDFGLGAWLGQRHENDTIQPISFASGKLSSSEKNYSATKKELLAIVWALQMFRSNLIVVPTLLERNSSCKRIIAHYHIYLVKNPSTVWFSDGLIFYLSMISKSYTYQGIRIC